jgi:hypothetical protein
VFKNFFINGGMNFGLKAGNHVDVMRRLPVHDPIKNASIGDLRVKVGTLEIIHSEDRLSVAKLVTYDSMEKRPLLDYEAVMVGDRLDLSSIRAAPTPQIDAQIAIPLESEKVALLKAKTRAEKLIQEGERSLTTLELKTKSQAAAARSNTSKVARAPASVGTKTSPKVTGQNSKKVGKTPLKKK